MNVTVAILAGGKSRRMGQDKARLALPGGEPLLQRTVELARAVAETVLVVGRERPGEWTETATVFLPDAAPDAGPAGGLLAALQRAGGPVLLLPCDAPHLSVKALGWLVETLTRGGATCAGTVDGQLQPFCAVYTPDCLPLLEARLAKNKRSLVGLIEELVIAELATVVTLPPWVAEATVDVDTPDDWARATGSAPA